MCVAQKRSEQIPIHPTTPNHHDHRCFRNKLTCVQTVYRPPRKPERRPRRMPPPRKRKGAAEAEGEKDKPKGGDEQEEAAAAAAAAAVEQEQKPKPKPAMVGKWRKRGRGREPPLVDERPLMELASPLEDAKHGCVAVGMVGHGDGQVLTWDDGPDSGAEAGRADNDCVQWIFPKEGLEISDHWPDKLAVDDEENDEQEGKDCSL